MSFVVPIVVFLLGIVAGSFLTVLLRRLRTRELFFKINFYCPSCQKNLRWNDLVPLVSFLFLRGRCRYCEKKIGWQYPLIELVTGLLFLAAYFFRMQVDGSVGMSGALLLRDWLAIGVLLCVFVFDLRYSLIPRALVLPTSLIVAFLGFVGGEGLLSPILGVVVAAGFFAVQYVVSHGKWIGFGDVTLGVFMGCVLGMPKVLVALFIAYVLGAVVSVVFLITKKKNFKSEIPFGTFLSIATLITIFFGDRLINWYMSLL